MKFVANLCTFFHDKKNLNYLRYFVTCFQSQKNMCPKPTCFLLHLIDRYMNDGGVIANEENGN